MIWVNVHAYAKLDSAHLACDMQIFEETDWVLLACHRS